MAEVGALVPGADLEAGVADLGDMASIRAFAGSYLAGHDALDVLFNNAGVMACPRGRTADGFETQFGTNHLGHFLLTALLYPALQAGEQPRVVTLSSGGHSRADVDLEDPNFDHTEYSPWVAYGQAETANALFARELARRAGSSGRLSFAVHPGVIATDLGRHLTDDLLKDMAEFARRRSADAGGGGEARGMAFKTVEAAQPPRSGPPPPLIYPTTTEPTWPTVVWGCSGPTPAPTASGPLFSMTSTLPPCGS